jgi:hypothetical protein
MGGVAWAASAEQMRFKSCRLKVEQGVRIIGGHMAKKRSKTKGIDASEALPEGVQAWISLLEYKRRKARQLYEAFFEGAKTLPPIERAEAWLRHVADNPDNDGDLEAIVYLASRGYDCAKYISRTIIEWKEAEATRLRENASALKIPEFMTNDITSASPFFLRDFWTCHRSQEDAIDATMLRVVEWCGIGGFEPWWKRLARSANEAVLRGGMESLRACFWLVNKCRSPYAINLMPRVLDRCLETIEPCDEYQPFPWIPLLAFLGMSYRCCQIASPYFAPPVRLE